MAQTLNRTFMSASAARAMALDASDDDELDEEPGEVIESAPPLRPGEERPINAAGVRKKLLNRGHGWATPVSGDEVTVHYVGTLLDGTEFDSTRKKGEPLTFKLGSGEVFGGLNQGIVTMTKGELAQFKFPSSMTNDYVGLKGVPPGADIQFEVELVSWRTVVDIFKDGGIVKKILSSGDDIQTGDMDEVMVNYQAKLLDGSVVAETAGVQFYVNQGIHTAFTLLRLLSVQGNGLSKGLPNLEHFCPALPKIIKTMRQGEKALVTVQPQYAFGEKGRDTIASFPAIPSNATIQLYVDLLSIKHVVDVTGDSNVLKKIFRTGEGFRTPKDGETVHVRYTAMLQDGTVFERSGFDEGIFEFVIDEEEVIAGLDLAVQTMLKGELSQILVKPEYAFGNDEVKRGEVIIPARSTLVYEVELEDFVKEKELWEMSGLDKIETAGKIKVSGNDLYKIGKFQRAFKKFNKALSYVDEDWHFEDDEEKLVNALRVSCWLNSAACCLKMGNFHEAASFCSKVLDVETCNVKALYRRAQAQIGIANLDLAKLDVQKALELDPHNKEVRSLEISLKHIQAESNKKDAKLYANMFRQSRKDPGFAVKKLKGEEDERKEQDDMDESQPQSLDLLEMKNVERRLGLQNCDHS